MSFPGLPWPPTPLAPSFRVVPLPQIHKYLLTMHRDLYLCPSCSCLIGGLAGKEA